AVRVPGKRAARAIAKTPVNLGTRRFEPSNARLAMSNLSHRIVAAQDFRDIVEKRRRNFLQLLEWQEVAPAFFYNVTEILRRDDPMRQVAHGQTSVRWLETARAEVHWRFCDGAGGSLTWYAHR